ncbi:MAG TPA: hypothetical protein VGK67_30570 [Myxococcales bacterium]|jgi:hypothetical protein
MANKRAEREPQPAPPWEPRPWAVVLGLAALSAAFCAPVLLSGQAFGIDDWDQQLFYAHAARRSLLVYGQFPWWNPWYCGGSPLLANPSSGFLNPLFALSLPLGTLWGAKVQVAAHLFVAMLGAWLFARRLGARGLAVLLAPVVFGLSSGYTLHLGTGHTLWFAWAYLPFAALFACGAIDAAARGEARRAGLEAAGAGLAAALLLFSGNAYFFVYQCLFTLLYGLLRALPSKPWRDAWKPLAGGAAVGLTTLLFGAVKLLPMMDFLGRVSKYEAKDASGAALELVWLALVGRDQSLTAHQLPGMQWRWWEYGAYVGLAALALAAVGLALSKPRPWRLGLVALFFVLLAMGNGGPVWPLLRSLQAFEGLRVPSRAIAYGVLAVSALAALGASWLVDWTVRRRLLSGWQPTALAGTVVFLVAADFFAVTRSPLQEAFTLPPVALEDVPASAPFRQVRGRVEFKTRARYTDLLDHAVRNEGVLNCYERLHLPLAAQASTLKDASANPAYRGEAYVEGSGAAGGGASPTLSFTPNRLMIDVAAAGGGTLIVNQSFDSAWSAQLRGQAAPIANRSGVLAIELPADGAPAKVELEYTPSRLGAAITLLSLLGSLGALGWELLARRRREAAAALAKSAAA